MLKEKEAKKKEAGMAVVDASPSHAESVNLVKDVDWAFSVQCCYNPLLHYACFEEIAGNVHWEKVMNKDVRESSCRPQRSASGMRMQEKGKEELTFPPNRSR